MEEKEMNEMSEYITLTDEDGNEYEFELLAECEKNGNTYYAVIEVKDSTDNANEDILEYVVLKRAVENGEEILATIDDDDELDDIADYFDDLFSQEIDYDNN